MAQCCQKYLSHGKKLKIKVVRYCISSKKVCQRICLSAHLSGVEGAPKIGMFEVLFCRETACCCGQHKLCGFIEHVRFFPFDFVHLLVRTEFLKSYNLFWNTLYIERNAAYWRQQFRDIWAIGMKLSVIEDTYTYLRYIDKKSPIV